MYYFPILSDDEIFLEILNNKEKIDNIKTITVSSSPSMDSMYKFVYYLHCEEAKQVRILFDIPNEVSDETVFLLLNKKEQVELLIGISKQYGICCRTLTLEMALS